MTLAVAIIVLGGVAAFIGAVWFGMIIVAPRIGRADADQEEPGDRSD